MYVLRLDASVHLALRSISSADGCRRFTVHGWVSDDGRR
jgi:hypothetical protein